jgi:hypothetical protein
MLAQTGMYVGAGRLTLAQEHVIHEHAIATEYHGMGHNGAISEDTNGNGGRHEGLCYGCAEKIVPFRDSASMRESLIQRCREANGVIGV